MPEHTIPTSLDYYRPHLIWAGSIAGLAVMTYLLLASEGTHTHDEIGHYLISRDAWQFPQLIMDTWGRFLHTLLYLIPTYWGLFGARMFSLILALTTVYLTTLTARRIQVRYWYLVPFLLFFQPWFLELAFLNITQVPFMLFMTAVIWLLVNDRWALASFTAGLLPLLRHEGIALAFLLFFYFAYKKKWGPSLVTFLPFIAYNLVSFLWVDKLPLNIFTNTVPNTIYGSGSWYHYLIRLPHPHAVGIPVLLLAMLSLPKIILSKRLTLISLWYISYLVLHSVIFKFGLFASGGYKFFLLPMAPAFAILAGLGFQQLEQWLDRISITKNTRVILLGFLAIIVLWNIIFVRPHELTSGDKAVKKAASWVQDHNLQNRVEAATHVYFYYFLPYKIDPVTLWESFEPLEKMESGSIVVWDEQYSNRWGLKRSYFEKNTDTWTEQASFGSSFCLIYEKK